MLEYLAIWWLFSNDLLRPEHWKMVVMIYGTAMLGDCSIVLAFYVITNLRNIVGWIDDIVALFRG